ncbi:MAG: YybH family protein [Chitinophagaceae bacterium]
MLTKTLVSAILATGIILVTACGHTENTPATAEELSQMNRDFAKALNNNDAVAAANCYAEDATILPPGEAPVTGKANIQKYWEGALSSGAFDVEVATTSTNSNGDLGYEVGRFQMSIRDSAGNTTIERGKYIELLVRGKDGKWLSTHGIWNTDTLPLK